MSCTKRKGRYNANTIWKIHVLDCMELMYFRIRGIIRKTKSEGGVGVHA